MGSKKLKRADYWTKTITTNPVMNAGLLSANKINRKAERRPI
jgi:hypothetical protein